ncbi:MAG: ATP-binding protein [Formivibrio sp.]|nr:ATP-binding protein [Formivibrio sp.]
MESTEEFHGFKLVSGVDLGGNIAAIVGRNGSGKSRLLHAIYEGKANVTLNNGVIPRGRIVHLTMDKLQPSLTFGFDQVQHRQDVNSAIAQYNANRDKFLADPLKTIESFGHPRMGGRSAFNISSLAHIASTASLALHKDVSALDDQDIADFILAAPMMSLGSLNVTATMLAYWDRLELNKYHEYRNEKYAEKLPYWPPTEFEARFGPAPWDVFNEFLQSVLDGRYHIKAPTNENIAAYEAKLFREDTREIDPSWLSSGEKVLMWLCLSMYVSGSRRLANPPQLLLLDEPDAALHPQMVQKLHVALQTIATRFNSNIIFTTHSPTTVALFNAGRIFQASESNLVQLEKDAAISELLVGVDQVSIQYNNRRQVYVESFNDAEIYGYLFRLLKRWKKVTSEHISLSFIPAAPKLSPSSVQSLLNTHFGQLDTEKVDSFVNALNGQGNCVQVFGAVENLVDEGSSTIHGIVDWDRTNTPQQHVHILGAEKFYSIENAILNPLTLGLYLLHNYPDKLLLEEYGLDDSFDPLSLYVNAMNWQSIANGVTKRVLNIDTVAQEIDCFFLTGDIVKFDSRYVHMNGHALENALKGKAYPFLNAFTKRPSLLMDVVQRGIQSSQGRSMPMAFADLFCAIQSSC